MHTPRLRFLPCLLLAALAAGCDNDDPAAASAPASGFGAVDGLSEIMHDNENVRLRRLDERSEARPVRRQR